MAGRQPPEAVQNYVAPLQRAISCVCPAIFGVGGGYYPRTEPHTLLLNRGHAVRLHSPEPLWLRVVQHYRIIEATVSSGGPWRVQTVTYHYTLLETEDDEILAYHWHPRETPALTFPHLHLEAGAGTLRPTLQKAHMPTGRVALEDVLRLAIREFGAEPQRDDWQTVLDETQVAFDRWRTW